MYQIFDFARLPTISHIIWDIDGTITDENGQVNQEVAAKIIRLGLNNGVYHSFVTGRDARWVIRKIIEPMKRFFNFPRVVDNLIFFAEVGCIVIKVDSSGNITRTPNIIVKGHPLVTNQNGIRDTLKELAYHPNDPADRYKPGQEVKPPYEIIYDADDAAWVIDRSQEKTPRCHPYIWSPYKEIFATLEKLRDSQGRFKTFDQEPYAATVIKAIKAAGFGDQIDVEIVSTAINIVPKVEGIKFGKSWAAGKALECVWQAKLNKGPVFETVIDRTIAVGDGKADLEFTVPTFSPEVQKGLKHSTLHMIFVGAEADLPTSGSPEEAFRQNIIIQGTGRGNLSFDEPADLIRFERAKGARVVNAVLNFLHEWEYFSSF